MKAMVIKFLTSVLPEFLPAVVSEVSRLNERRQLREFAEEHELIKTRMESLNLRIKILIGLVVVLALWNLFLTYWILIG